MHTANGKKTVRPELHLLECTPLPCHIEIGAVSLMQCKCVTNFQLENECNSGGIIGVFVAFPKVIGNVDRLVNM